MRAGKARESPGRANDRQMPPPVSSVVPAGKPRKEARLVDSFIHPAGLYVRR